MGVFRGRVQSSPLAGHFVRHDGAADKNAKARLQHRSAYGHRKRSGSLLLKLRPNMQVCGWVFLAQVPLVV